MRDPKLRDEFQGELVDLADEYIKHELVAHEVAINTARAIRSDFRGLFRFLQSRRVGLTLAAFTYHNLDGYFMNLRSQPEVPAKSTLDRRRDTFQSFGKWAVLMEKLTKNPVKAITLPKAPRTSRQFAFEAGQAARFLSLSEGAVLPVDVDRVLRRLLLYTGLRQSEMIRLQWKHIDWEREKLSVFHSKFTRQKGNPEGLDRRIPICRQLKVALESLKHIAVDPSPEGCVLTNVHWRKLTRDRFYEAFHPIRDAMGYSEDEFQPHCLRHNLSAGIIQSGGTLADAAEVLGHANHVDPSRIPTVTDAYVTMPQDRIRGLLQRYAESVEPPPGPPRPAVRVLTHPTSIVPPTAPPAPSPVAPGISPSDFGQLLTIFRQMFPGSQLSSPEWIQFLEAYKQASALAA